LPCFQVYCHHQDAPTTPFDFDAQDKNDQEGRMNRPIGKKAAMKKKKQEELVVSTVEEILEKIKKEESPITPVENMSYPNISTDEDYNTTTWKLSCSKTVSSTRKKWLRRSGITKKWRCLGILLCWLEKNDKKQSNDLSRRTSLIIACKHYSVSSVVHVMSSIIIFFLFVSTWCFLHQKCEVFTGIFPTRRSTEISTTFFLSER
jgi:hypothetical protein